MVSGRDWPNSIGPRAPLLLPKEKFAHRTKLPDACAQPTKSHSLALLLGAAGGGERHAHRRRRRKRRPFWGRKSCERSLWAARLPGWTRTCSRRAFGQGAPLSQQQQQRQRRRRVSFADCTRSSEEHSRVRPLRVFEVRFFDTKTHTELFRPQQVSRLTHFNEFILIL